jgi:hypothetical protein
MAGKPVLTDSYVGLPVFTCITGTASPANRRKTISVCQKQPCASSNGFIGVAAVFSATGILLNYFVSGHRIQKPQYK